MVVNITTFITSYTLKYFSINISWCDQSIRDCIWVFKTIKTKDLGNSFPEQVTSPDWTDFTVAAIPFTLLIISTADP